MRLTRVGVDVVAVAAGYAYAGVIIAAALAVIFIVLSLRRARVIAIPTKDQATRGDAGLIAARVESLAEALRSKAEEATAIAAQLKEGR